MNISDLTIAVTGMNATENPGPGVSVIRAIKASGEFNGKVIGLTYDPLDPGIFMDKICDHAYLLTYPSEGSNAFMGRIREINSKTKIDVLIPTLDSELPIFIDHEDELREMGIHTFLPSKTCFDLRSKEKFNKLKERFSINVPRGKVVSDLKAALSIKDEFNFPVMVKGQFYEAYMAWTPMEVDFYFRKISSKWGFPVIIQEYIQGEEYDVVALGDGEGGLIGAVPMKKMQLTEKGKAWGGITVWNEGLNEFVESAVSSLKWRGPCELEIIHSSNNDQFYLIEINPRFPAWSYLTTGAGQNLQLATLKLALGLNVEKFENFNIGAFFLRNSIDHIYPLKDFENISTAGEIHRRDIPEIYIG